MKFEYGLRKFSIDGTIQKENGVDMITPYKIVNGQTVVDESKLGNGNQISKVIAIGEDTITVKTWNTNDGANAEKNANTQIRYTSLTAAKNAQSQ